MNGANMGIPIDEENQSVSDMGIHISEQIQSLKGGFIGKHLRPSVAAIGNFARGVSRITGLCWPWRP
jgi:hypothetical protein